MSRKEKIDEVNGIQLHIQFCSFEKNSRYLQEYLGFGWQKNNADKSIPLPVAIIGPGAVHSNVSDEWIWWGHGLWRVMRQLLIPGLENIER